MAILQSIIGNNCNVSLQGSSRIVCEIRVLHSSHSGLEGRERGRSIEVQRMATIKGKALDHTTAIGGEEFIAAIQRVKQVDEDVVQ